MKKELFVSFAGHITLLIVAGFLTTRQKPKEFTRPAVITVQILKGGAPEEEKPSRHPRLIEPAPKVRKPQKVPPQPKPKTGEKGADAIVRRPGLGAKVEGFQALGYNYYLQQMLERIGENWAESYLGAPDRLRATVQFVVERDGRLTEVKLEKSSGDVLYDESCVRAVIITRKLPPLPEEFTAPRLKIHLEFER